MEVQPILPSIVPLYCVLLCAETRHNVYIFTKRSKFSILFVESGTLQK